MPISSLATRQTNKRTFSWQILISAIALLLPFQAVAAPAESPDPSAAIALVLQQSAAAWNAGSLDDFMRTYEDSPQTTSISGQTIVHGYANIKARYVRRYGSKIKGRLSFSDLTVRPLGHDYALAIARFHLIMPDGTRPTGPFSLILHRTVRGWLIILDH